MACQGPQTVGGPPDRWTAAAAPPIIYHQKNSDSTVTSYSADVEVYSQSSHKIGAPQLVQKYKMATKLIDGRLYTRLDVGADAAPDKLAKAYVSDGVQMVVIDPISLRVYARANLSQTTGQLQDLATTQAKTLFGRVSAAEWKAPYQKLNFDITEDQASHRLGVSIPANLLLSTQSVPGYTIKRAKLLYDTAQETPAGIEMAVTNADGQDLTFVTQPVYAEKDGIPVKVADVTQVVDPSQKLSSANADYDYAVPEAKVDDIPVVTEADLNQMQADGAQVMYIEPTVTSASPDAPDTTLITTYDQIHLNDTPDSFFKIAF